MYYKGNLENKRVSGRSLYYLPTCAQYKFVQVEKIWEQWFVEKQSCQLSQATLNNRSVVQVTAGWNLFPDT